MSKRKILVSLSALPVLGKNKIKVTDALQGTRTKKAREQERVGGNENDIMERHILISQPSLNKSMSLYFFITHRWTIPMKDYPRLLRVQEKRNTTEEWKKGKEQPLNVWLHLCHACEIETKQERGGIRREKEESFPMVILLAEGGFLKTALYFTVSCECTLTNKKQTNKQNQP